MLRFHVQRHAADKFGGISPAVLGILIPLEVAVRVVERFAVIELAVAILVVVSFGRQLIDFYISRIETPGIVKVMVIIFAGPERVYDPAETQFDVLAAYLYYGDKIAALFLAGYRGLVVLPVGIQEIRVDGFVPVPFRYVERFCLARIVIGKHRYKRVQIWGIFHADRRFRKVDDITVLFSGQFDLRFKYLRAIMYVGKIRSVGLSVIVYHAVAHPCHRVMWNKHVPGFKSVRQKRAAFFTVRVVRRVPYLVRPFQVYLVIILVFHPADLNGPLQFHAGHRVEKNVRAGHIFLLGKRENVRRVIPVKREDHSVSQLYLFVRQIRVSFTRLVAIIGPCKTVETLIHFHYPVPHFAEVDHLFHPRSEKIVRSVRRNGGQSYALACVTARGGVDQVILLRGRIIVYYQ